MKYHIFEGKKNVCNGLRYPSDNKMLKCQRLIPMMFLFWKKYMHILNYLVNKHYFITSVRSYNSTVKVNSMKYVTPLKCEREANIKTATMLLTCLCSVNTTSNPGPKRNTTT